jgi:hypothetical protein
MKKTLAFALLVALAIASPATAQPQVDIDDPAQFCLAIPDPVPSGVTDRPNHNFNTFPDYNFVHSSTHLSGNKATEKFAPGLFWNPPAPLTLSGFRSALKITNPNPVGTPNLVGRVEFYDEGGVPLGNVPFNIIPEASVTLAASPLAAGTPAGRGSARILSTNGVALVGETIHNTLSVNLTGFGGPVVTDPDPFNPGASSMQQLQVRQSAKTDLYMGPFPVSDQSTLDVMNGNNPLFWIHNPNPTPTTVSVLLLSSNGINLGTVTVTLQPFASYLELRLWNALWPFYLGGPINYDDDFLLFATADQGILGEFVMTDLFGNGGGAGDHLNLGTRFRMGSGMLANTPAVRVWNPELTYQPNNLGIQTTMGILNAGTQNIGPVTIQFRDRNGVVLGNSTVASLPRGAMLRIGPGITPNYPGTTFDGWVRITACKPGLVGWTMRTAGDEPNAAPPPFKKIWGEALAGANGSEPGNGFGVLVGGQNRIRKVASFIRADSTFYWPGYTAFVNHATANIGPYEYRYFFDGGGPAGVGAFAGLRWANTSFNFEDPFTNTFGATNLSERVDHTNGSIQGIHVIGDPLVEWGIFNQIPIVVEADPDQIFEP